MLSLQIVSQKDEHCWVGELNGLRGELEGVGGSDSVPFVPLPPDLTHSLCCSHRLVSSQVCGSPG